MKKVFRSVGISLLLIMALSACGSDSGAAGSGDGAVVTEDRETADTSQTVSDEAAEASDGEDGTSEDSAVDPEQKRMECALYVFTAFQNMDAEALKPFLEESDYNNLAEGFGWIQDNPEDAEFWKQTVGTMRYFPESDVLIARSPEYVGAKWYTDCWKNNAEIPAEDSQDFPKEYLDEIYDTYYKDAPYTIINGFGNEIMSQDEEGNYLCYLFKMLPRMGYDELSGALRDHGNSAALRAAILLDCGNSYGLGYDYISDDIPGYEAILSKDLDGMIQIVDTGVELEENNTSARCYNDYYKDAQNQELLQQYLNDECEVYRELDQIHFYLPIDVDNTFPYSYVLTENDKAELRQMNVRFVYSSLMSSFPDNFDNNFTPYYDLVEFARYQGIVE